MMGLRNLYRVFSESRKTTRRRATVGVTGDSPRAQRLAALLGAQKGAIGAEVVIDVPDAGDAVALSGEIVDAAERIEVEGWDDVALRHRLIPRIVRALDKDYLVAVASAYPPMRRAACEEMIRNNARENAFIGALPIPGADMPVMTANQGRLVLGIAAAHGEKLTMERARELLGVLAAGLGFRALSRQVVKLIPIGGWAASAAIGYAGTVALGRAAVLYFERGAHRLGEEELARIRERAAREGRQFVERWRESRKGG